MPTIFRKASLALLALTLVAAGPFGRKRTVEDTADATRPEVPRVRVPPDIIDLWTESVPFEIGAIPDGLGSLSAQNCAACHTQAHESWAAGAHSRAAVSDEWREAAHASGSAECSSCHLPALEQHDQITQTDGKDTLRAANPIWSPTLATEGVTCASCHVRDGHVIAGRPGVKAPHPTQWSTQFSESTFCASCHQMTWAGADKPLYDTFGEWERSPQGKAGVTCQACHLGPGASGISMGTDHRPDHRKGRGLTLLVELSTATPVRGGDALTGAVRVQNTGAGHHIPTGSPFSGLRLLIQAEIKDADKLWRSDAIASDFARELDASPPYATTADTRIAAGEERSVPFELVLPIDAPTGRASVVVQLVRTLRGELTDDILQTQRIPLRMD
ncbi:MAG: hypothetical protein KC912_02410 [Proteobacteria bacterium]|nr:hypothetical protein [Pseudomonadota bacterium]